MDPRKTSPAGEAERPPGMTRYQSSMWHRAQSNRRSSKRSGVSRQSTMGRLTRKKQLWPPRSARKFSPARTSPSRATSGRVPSLDDRRIVIADAGPVHAPGCRPFAQRALGSGPQCLRTERAVEAGVEIFRARERGHAIVVCEPKEDSMPEIERSSVCGSRSGEFCTHPTC
jgi:hypothetical protein